MKRVLRDIDHRMPLQGETFDTLIQAMTRQDELKRQGVETIIGYKNDVIENYYGFFTKRGKTIRKVRRSLRPIGEQNCPK